MYTFQVALRCSEAAPPGRAVVDWLMLLLEMSARQGDKNINCIVTLEHRPHLIGHPLDILFRDAVGDLECQEPVCGRS